MADYVTNKDFHAALVERKKLKAKDPDIRVSNYIGECFYKICSNLAHKHNFNGYSYKDEMIADAVESCLAAVDKFDTEKQNPFAYFTQCAFFAFLQRIKKEQKQQKVKGALIQRMVIDGAFVLNGEDLPEDFDTGFMEEIAANSFFDVAEPQKVKPINTDPGLTVFCAES